MLKYYLFESDLKFICTFLDKEFRKLRNTRIFITGATGVVGKWLLASLLYADDTFHLNLSMTILTRNKTAFGDKFPMLCFDERVSILEGDIKDFQTDIKVDYFIHGAADVVKVDLESEIFMSNILGTHNALKQAVKSKAKRFLYLSSGAVYGKLNLQNEGINESDRGAIDFLNANSAYSLGKRGGEFLTNRASDEFDMSVSSARCFALAGPHLPLDKHFAFGNFMLSALKNKRIKITGNGKVYRSYLYLADVCIWLLKIAINGENKKSYNVGSDQSVSILQLAKKIKLEIGADSEINIGSFNTDKPYSDYYFPNTYFTKKTLNLDANYSLSDIIKITADWHINGNKYNA